MINHKHLLRFLTKKEISISVEEYLFLLTVRYKNEGFASDWEEVSQYANLYYNKNVFYGRDLYPKEEAKRMEWNILIDKLVKQNYLLDYRKEKDIIDWEFLKTTEEFNSKIWCNDKQQKWDEIVDLVYDRVGSGFVLPNGTHLNYFLVTKSDVVDSYEKMIDYWWTEICLGGMIYSIEEFRHHLEKYIDKNSTIPMKFITFLVNYKNGVIKKEILKFIEEHDY